MVSPWPADTPNRQRWIKVWNDSVDRKAVESVLYAVSKRDDELMSVSDEDEHNVWSRVVGFCFLFSLGRGSTNCLADVEVGRLS